MPQNVHADLPRGGLCVMLKGLGRFKEDDAK